MHANAIVYLSGAHLSYDFTGTHAIELGAGLTHAELSGAKLSAGGGGFGDALLDLSEDADLLIAMSRDLLSALPVELQLLIADAVGDRCDRAALALASPRLLGLAACRELPSYQGLEMSLAFHHVLGGPIDEQLLRSYASRSEATLEGCEWLAEVAAAGLRIRVAVSGTAQKWHLFLMQPDSTVGALLCDMHLYARTVKLEGEEGAERMVRSEAHVCHYKGEKGVERVVRRELPNDGAVLHYEGEKGAERLACIKQPRGMVSHYEGEKGAERVAWREWPCGSVSHYEGDAERMVRIERPCGQVCHYEGEKGAERLVRSELPYGMVSYYEGGKGAERLVRWELPGGQVCHYEGEEDVERIVRWELPCGQVCHYEGEEGAERMVRRERPCGQVCHYEGEQGVEREMRCEFPSGQVSHYGHVWSEPSGTVLHYEGEKGVERMVRIERPNSTVTHYKGEKGAERKVRMKPSGYPAARWLTTRARTARRAWSEWCALRASCPAVRCIATRARGGRSQ